MTTIQLYDSRPIAKHPVSYVHRFPFDPTTNKQLELARYAFELTRPSGRLWAVVSIMTIIKQLGKCPPCFAPVDMLKLIKNFSLPNVRRRYDLVPFHVYFDGPLALKYEMIAKTPFHLINKATLSTVADADGRTLLHHAVSWFNVELTTYLLQRGFDVNARTDKNKTALSSTVTGKRHRRDRRIANLLLAYGAVKTFKTVTSASFFTHYQSMQRADYRYRHNQRRHKR